MGMPLWAWILFYIIVVIMLVIDLKMFSRKGEHEVDVGEALRMTAVWIGVSLLFCFGIYLFDGAEPSYEVALERADTAQYHAKQSNKNAFRFYDEVVDAWDENFTAAPDNAQPDMAASSVTGAPAPQAAH